ncbi:24235_t:CDS:2 [Gigaspora margarita]|uniref:24235_t:CDS:1 n=1 Tax=Gigaspora margarita TaxID=4874 RepID=A0ABN7VMT4_GIGMA|nr:24235_t:CDS:2 [Gigaspora margarita]
MNWLPSVPQSDQEKVMESIIENNSDKYKSRWVHNFSPFNANNIMANITSIVTEVSNEINALYDHAHEFEKYMETKRTNKTAKKVGLRQRTVHRIVPKRLSYKHYVEWEIVA